MRKILFVCTGNICRSPTAEAVFRHLAAGKGFEVDSAGTHDYHTGDPPDRRALKTALSRGIAMEDLRARKVVSEDFECFDCILAMDRGHLEILKSRAPASCPAEIMMFSDFSPALKGCDVPDPYYGGMSDFEMMMEMIWTGCEGIVSKI